jgi:excisionase family DNA binding protein
VPRRARGGVSSLLDEVVRQVVRDEVRQVVREELRSFLRELRPDGNAGASPELLSVKEAAEEVGVNPATIRNWVHQGRLARYGTGRIWRVRRPELFELLRQAEAGPQSPPSPADEAAEILRRQTERARAGRTPRTRR